MAAVVITNGITSTGSSVLADTMIVVSNALWTGWNNGTSTDRFDTGFADPWPIWNQTTSVSINPWIAWNDVTVTTNRFTADIRMGVERLHNPELEAAHRRQREADQRVYETRLHQSAVKRMAANERAEKLLMSILSSAQRAQYKSERRFTVHLPNGNHYMIRQGRHGNIERIDESGKRLENLCVHVAPYDIPDADNLAAQKLMLECNEPELRKIANIVQIAA